MKPLIILDRREDWPTNIGELCTVDAWTYLTDDAYNRIRKVRIINLCGSYRYQTTGYYVSLLAEARGHRPMPNILNMQDLQLRNHSIMRLLTADLEELIQKSFAPLQSSEFTLSVYFGRNLSSRYDRLSRQLFSLFQCPLLRFSFVKRERWQLRSTSAIAARDIPANHRAFVVNAARTFLERGANQGPKRSRKRPRYDLAILHDPTNSDHRPSDGKALERFVEAAERVGFSADLVTRDDLGRLLEYDALFIRENTQVNHHTYRWARRAAREGLVVIDDPVSITRCTNKVFLAEVLRRHRIPIPKTTLLHRSDAQEWPERLEFPCVLKRPDSAFSKGVVKVGSPEELKERLDDFFGESDLLIAQEFLPTEFDWRIGVLDGKPLYACKYFMARGHWQIIRDEGNGKNRYGRYETLPIEMAPRKAVSIALKATKLIGDGLYGVDIKESGGNFYVIEVNDNPNIDAGVEDSVLRKELYLRIMSVFLQRVEQQKAPTYD